MEQMEMDLRAESEVCLDDALAKAKAAAGNHVEACMYGSAVANRHEGYGLLTERFDEVAKGLKAVKTGMATFAAILPTDTRHAIDATSSITNAARDLMKTTALMAAMAEKVMCDLYAANAVNDERTPLEEMMDGYDEADPEAEMLEDVMEEEQEDEDGEDGEEE